MPSVADCRIEQRYQGDADLPQVHIAAGAAQEKRLEQRESSSNRRGKRERDSRARRSAELQLPIAESKGTWRRF